MKLRIALEINIANMTLLDVAALVNRIKAALGTDAARLVMRLGQ